MPKNGSDLPPLASSHPLRAHMASSDPDSHSLFEYCNLAHQACLILPIIGTGQGINVYWGQCIQQAH